MLILPHDTPRASVLQPALVVGDTWTTEVATPLPPAAAPRARGRKHRKAQKNGRRATATTLTVAVSSWLLAGRGLDTLRQQVQGTWSEASRRECLPRLRRFLVSSPRRRRHQESERRAWLDHLIRTGQGGLPEVA